MNQMNAVFAIRDTASERKDGTLVVRVEIDKAYVAQFQRLFPTIGMGMALAPMADHVTHEQTAPVYTDPLAETELDEAFAHDPDPEPVEVEPKPKVNHEMSRMAAMLCADSLFRQFLTEKYHIPVTSEGMAATHVRTMCDIKSRFELDTDTGAAERFHHYYRKPFVDWKNKRVAA